MNVSATPIPSGTITKSRIEFIDLLKAFVMFSIMWFHSLGDLRTGYFVLADPVFKFFATLHMPLFYMISGFFFSSSFNLSFKNFLQKKSVTLLIPHIAWGIIVVFLDWGLAFVGWNRPFCDKPLTIPSFLQGLFAPDPGIGDFWFFKDLFLTELIVFFSCKIFKKSYIAFIVSMLFVLMFSLSIETHGVIGRMQRYLIPLFWIGMLVKTYYPFVCRHLNKLLISAGIVFSVCFYFYDYTYIVYAMDFLPLINFQESFATGNLVFSSNVGILVFSWLTAIAGSLFFFFLFQRFWKKNGVTTLFSRCGQITLGLYPLQAIVLQRIMNNTLDFPNISIWVYRFIITPSTAAFTFLVSVLVVRLIQQNKGFTFILFGSSLVVDQGIIPYKNHRGSNGKQYQNV
jgi:fucose 4-O-acetylase-like acetyltransferase